MIEKGEEGIPTEKCDTQEEPSSLDLAYDWCKGVLLEQKRSSDRLENRATALFSVATTVLGIGVAAGIFEFEGVRSELKTVLLLPIIAYIYVIREALRGWTPKSFETINDPISIRKYCDKKPSEFKKELLTDIEHAFKRNEARLKGKADAVDRLILGTVVEVMLLSMIIFFLGL